MCQTKSHYMKPGQKVSHQLVIQEFQVRSSSTFLMPKYAPFTPGWVNTTRGIHPPGHHSQQKVGIRIPTFRCYPWDWNLKSFG